MKNHTPVKDEKPTTYKVIIDEEEQYAVWPSGRKLPAGWKAVGERGSKAWWPACSARLSSDMHRGGMGQG